MSADDVGAPGAATGADDTIRPPAVCVRDTGDERGRGVFATRTHAAGELVETAAVFVFSLRSAWLPELIKRCIYSWEVLAGVPGTRALALGYGSLYNHANPANMRYEADADRQVLRFIAVRQIDDGEELTINYNAVGGEAFWADDNWFENHGITVR